MLAHITKISSNSKTGKIPVTTTGKDSCPAACPLKNNGCYAEDYHLNLHWSAVTAGKRGIEWDEFCNQISEFKPGQLWRHNQAGDLIGRDNTIDTLALEKLVNANIGKRGYTYTHYPLINNSENLANVKNSNKLGFTINASANDDNQAMELFSLGIPVATIATKNKSYKLSNGVRVAICPAQKSDAMTCEKCKLCAVSDRDYIIGFIPHGTKAKKVINIVSIN